jgi:hypothetical protein
VVTKNDVPDIVQESMPSKMAKGTAGNVEARAPLPLLEREKNLLLQQQKLYA